MKKTAIPVVLVFAFLLSGCTIPWVTNAPITGTEEQKAAKLADIIAGGGSAECTVTNLADNSTINYLVAGNKMKTMGADFGEDKKGIMINDSTNTYTWTEGEKTGFKMKNPTAEEMQESAERAKDYEQYNTGKLSVEYEDETKYSLNCSKRTVTDSEFAPPADVTFTDPTQTQNMTPEELMKLYPQGE